ncbi:MAG TPA: hypothetical protein VFK05_38940 [Polyangiaceae bacterium]|nr:hypothetical protein [Polyangiaceae bacterium]
MKRALAWFSLLVWGMCSGCAAAPPAPSSAPPKAAAGELTRYLPLENDTVFSYATYIEETNERGLAVFEIKRPRPELAELSIAGQVRKRYYFEPEGVRSSHGGYLLKSPLSLHAEWTGDDGQVKVTKVDLSVDAPAGKFSGCLETVEDARLGSATRKTTTVFCPGVGITVLEIEAEGEGTSVSQRLILKSFGPRFKAP